MDDLKFDADGVLVSSVDPRDADVKLTPFQERWHAWAEHRREERQLQSSTLPDGKGLRHHPRARKRFAITCHALCNDGEYRRREVIVRGRPNLWGARSQLPPHVHLPKPTEKAP